MGQAGYDWVAVDLEHGAISVHQLPDFFRALELGGTLPLARLVQGQAKGLQASAGRRRGGVIVPMVESAAQPSGCATRVAAAGRNSGCRLFPRQPLWQAL